MCHIDSIKMDCNDASLLNVQGWESSIDNNDFNIEVYVDGNRATEVGYSRLERADVLRVHPKLPIACGFEIKYELPNVKFERIQLFKREGTKKELLQSIPKCELFKDIQTIYYNIDNVQVENGVGIISGWAFSAIEEQVKISLIGIQDYTVKKVIRNDVKLAFNHVRGLDENKIGFEVLFSAKRGNNIKLEIADAFNKEVEEYSIRKIKQEYNKVIKLSKYIHIENIKKSIRLIQTQGVKVFFNKVKSIYLKLDNSEIDYNEWLSLHLPNNEELQKQKETHFQYNPLISIVVPTYNTPKQFLIEMIESVREQTYQNWELCIADGSDSKTTKALLKDYTLRDTRIKVVYLDENKGISDNTNEALKLAQGEYIALFDHDDVLTPDALYENIKVINEVTDVDFIYSDEDKTDEKGSEFFNPYFKPDWSPDTLRSYNYLCHFSVFKKSLLEEVGVFKKEYDGAQDYDMFFRLTEKAKKIIHIPKILYHWRVHKNSTASGMGAKNYAIKASKNALSSHLERIGLNGEVTEGLFIGSYKINYDLKEDQKVSIIIPNKDNIEDLKKCIDSILRVSTYENYEIIIVENNSVNKETFRYYHELELNPKIKILQWTGIFNYAAINNYGVGHASGEILLFLNNDVEIITPGWIEEMIMFAQREDVGAVGAKLYYPDETVQHAGVIIGIGGVAGHSHKYFHKSKDGHAGRLKIAQNLSAVTAACLMMRKDVFNMLEGFDEEFKVAFNDVDLCMRVRELGKLVVYTPFAELYHYESKSRGAEDTFEKIDRFNNEIKVFKERWGLYRNDPYYNVNLTLDREDFSLSLKR